MTGSRTMLSWSALSLLLLAGCFVPSLGAIIGTGAGKETAISSVNFNAVNTATTSTLVATLSGTTDGSFGGDAAGTGTATLTLNGDAINAVITVTGLTGTMPPFQSFIRIGSGIFTNRVVLGTPSDAGWTLTGSTYTLTTSWVEDDIFPRTPGYTLAEIFGFLADEPASFYVNVATTSFPSGAIRGPLSAST